MTFGGSLFLKKFYKKSQNPPFYELFLQQLKHYALLKEYIFDICTFSIL